MIPIERAKLFLCILVYLQPLLIIAQPRVDGKNALVIDKSSQIISNPVGWAFEEYPSQKWCGYYGVIFDEFRNNNKKPIWPNISNMRVFDLTNNQSVITMQIKKTKIDTTTCYLLYVQRYWIDWDYPTIEVGRHNYKEFAIFVLPVDEYNKLWDIDTNVTKICLAGDVSYSPNYPIGCKNERAALTTLNDTKKLLISPYGGYFFYLKKDNENVVRFYPPTIHSMVGEKKKASWDTQVDLSKAYFEVSTATFNKLRIQ